MISERALRSLLGEVVAFEVSLDTYMERYAADFCEWVEGIVIRMPPVTEDHDNLTYYLRQLLQAYIELRPIATIKSQPFVMRLPAFPNRRREPDLFVVLNTNPGTLTPTYMDGAADICIEVVSEESIERDHGDKFNEYEKGGVREYWIMNTLRRECRFYRLNDAGRYLRQPEDANGDYRTPLLPGLALHVSMLWASSLPGPGATFAAVRAMLENDAQ